MLKVIKLLSLLLLLYIFISYPVKVLSQPNEKLKISPINSLTYCNGISYLDYNMLKNYFGSDTYINTANFTKLIEQYFIPANIRLVGISVGWEQHANTTNSFIPYNKWVDDFLTITDKYDIGVYFHFGTWQRLIKDHSWWDDVANAKPELLSSYKNGTTIDIQQSNPLIIDSPLIVEQLKEDLEQLYLYYGKHQSWLGIAFGGPNSSTYAPLDKTVADWGFSNYTLQNFFNSIFYYRDVDSNGHHEIDNTECKLWNAFKDNRSLQLLSSGFRQRANPTDIYGEDEGSMVAFYFRVSKTLEGFRISWYGDYIGLPGDLIFELYNQTINPPFFNKPLERVIISPSDVNKQLGWQPFVQFETILKGEGTYVILVKSNAGDELNKYRFYYREWTTDDSAFFTTDKGPLTGWHYTGGAILWIKDLENNDISIFPFQKSNIGSDGQFRSPANITFNMIFLYVSDRPYDTNTTTVKIVRISDKQVITKGILRQEYTKGMYYWMPIPLESEATLVEGEYYDIQFETTGGHQWQKHIINADPPIAGFQGKSKVFIFKLLYIDPIFVNYMRIGPPGRAGPEAGWPGAEYSTWWAQRYLVTKSASLLNVEINLEQYGKPGDLIVRLREDDGTGKAPSQDDIKTIRIATDDIPLGRTWINVTGWNVDLQANKTYWIILSTTEALKGNGYWPWKIEYAYEFMMRRSDDSGQTWVRPHEPAELYINLRTASEVFNVEPEKILTDNYISKQKIIAQSFSLPYDSTIYGSLIFLSRGQSDRNSNLTIEIRTDSGFDSPSSMVLTSSVISMAQRWVTYKGLEYFDFGYPYSLKGDTKYWLVFKSDSEFAIEPQVFAFHNPELSYGGLQYKVKKSTDGGLSWFLPSGTEADLLFGLVKSPFNAYRYTTEDLAQDIEIYHNHSIWEEPMRGWNVYLNTQTSNIQKELIEWFSSYTGRKWFSFDPNPSDIIHEIVGDQYLLGISKFNDLTSKNGTLADISIMPLMTLKPNVLNITEAYYKDSFPLFPKPVILFNISNISELNVSMNPELLNLFDTARRMVYVGNYSGLEKGVINDILNDNIQYSVSGRPGGPILLWPINNGPTTTFYISLNASFFQLSQEGWIVINMNSMLPISRGKGNIINITCLITNNTWTPIYIMNDTKEGYIIYSNFPIETETIYPNQKLIKYKSQPSQNIWLIIKENKSINTVTLGNYSIQREYSLNSILQLSNNNWFYDSDNGLLYIKFIVKDENQVRVIYDTSKSITLFIEQYPYVPYILLITLTIILELIVVIKKKLLSKRLRRMY